VPRCLKALVEAPSADAALLQAVCVAALLGAAQILRETAYPVFSSLSNVSTLHCEGSALLGKHFWLSVLLWLFFLQINATNMSQLLILDGTALE
jgi:hypothetical protein